MTMVQTNYELKYLLEVFSFERDNFDELVVEVQENLFRYPYLTFENWKDKDLRMPDPQVAGMSTNITWESTEDNTDLESFDSQTPFYRASITFTLRAYIYRKYAALLLEEVLNGYRVLDYNKFTQQIVLDDSLEISDSLSPSPEPGPTPPGPTPPGPDPGPDPEPVPTNAITTSNVAEYDAVGSIGLFAYTEPGEAKGYGSEVEGTYLYPISLIFADSGCLDINRLSDHMNGFWRLMCYARKRTEINPCIVLAVKYALSSSEIDSSYITIDNVAELDTVGSIGLFAYIAEGELKQYGSIINGSDLCAISIAYDESGRFTVTKSYTYMTGTWKLMTVAKKRTAIEPCVVLAVKIDGAPLAQNISTSSASSLHTSTVSGNTLNTRVLSNLGVNNDTNENVITNVNSNIDLSTSIDGDRTTENDIIEVEDISEDSHIENVQDRSGDNSQVIEPVSQVNNCVSFDEELNNNAVTLENDEDEENIEVGWFSLKHEDTSIKLNIIISCDNKYIYYDTDKEYTLVSLKTVKGRMIQDPLGVIKLVNHNGKLAIDTGGFALTAAYVEYNAEYKGIFETDQVTF